MSDTTTDTAAKFTNILDFDAPYIWVEAAFTTHVQYSSSKGAGWFRGPANHMGSDEVYLNILLKHLYHLESLEINELIVLSSSEKLSSIPDENDDCLICLKAIKKALTDFNQQVFAEVFEEFVHSYYSNLLRGDTTNISRVMSFIHDGSFSPIISNWKATNEEAYKTADQFREAFKQLSIKKVFDNF